MAFEDLREQLSEQWQSTWNRFLESSTGSQLAEQYESLPPAGQKSLIAGGALIAALVLLMIPWSWYSSSQDKIEEFTADRDLIKEMFNARRDSGEVGVAAQAIDAASLVSAIQSQLQTIQLAPEQIKSVQQYDNKAGGKSPPGIPANVTQWGASVSLGKLNLTQIVDIGHRLLTVAPSAKMVGMDVQAAADDARYFDVTYQLVSFAVPEPAAKPEKVGGRTKSGDGG